MKYRSAMPVCTNHGASTLLVVLAACLQLSAAQAPSGNACGLNMVNAADVQLANNMVLGFAPCTANVAGSGVCNIFVVQRTVNAVLTGTCAIGALHSVTLTWTASTSSNVIGYYVYRSIQSKGPYNRIMAAPTSATSYTDNAVQPGQTYYYVVTAIDAQGNQSVFSNEARAVVPSP
jgi:hypothetical protein